MFDIKLSRRIFFITGAAVLVLLLACLLLRDLLQTNYGRMVTVERDSPLVESVAGFTIEAVDKFSIAQSRLMGGAAVSPTDGMLMIFIPAGEFEMGSGYQAADNPPHIVYLDDYWIDRTEVSNSMYAQCILAGECELPADVESLDSYLANSLIADHPVVYIKWSDALAYCQWAGRRLPTEAEWEKAARGTDGRIYPWGKFGPNPNLLNYDGLIGSTVPVYRFPFGANPFGVLNMAGNVREWVWDWYSFDYTQISPQHNPLGPEQGEKKVLRGGAFTDSKRMVRADNRFSHVPYSPGYNRGFRCAKSP